MLLYTTPKYAAIKSFKAKLYFRFILYKCTQLNIYDFIIIIIIIITQIYNARNVIITILKHHKMNLRRGF